MGRILVAEDNHANLELMREILDMRGHEIIEAHDGSEALLQAELAHPDLILLDVNMPVLNGFEVLARLRSIPQLAHIKVVALTAYAMRGDRERALRAGFDGYLTKPVDIQTLSDAIDGFLDQRNEQGRKRYGT